MSSRLVPNKDPHTEVLVTFEVKFEVEEEDTISKIQSKRRCRSHDSIALVGI